MEIKKCPFCGGEATTKKYYPYDGYQGESARYLVYCSCCDCILTTSKNSNKQDIIKKWNRRVDDGRED